MTTKYRVYTTTDRGPTVQGPRRYLRGCVHQFPVNKAEACKLAKLARANPCVTNVEIKPTTDTI